MKRLAFTMASIAALKPPASGRVAYADTRTPGLQVRVSSTGTKAFSFIRRAGSRVVRVQLGRFPQASVSFARAQAAKLSAEIAEGKDPSERARLKRQEWTLQQLFDHWLTAHAKAHKRTWPEDERQFKAYLSQWATRKLSSIKQGDVADLHAKLGKRAPYQANRVLALLTTLYSYADGLGYTGGNPCRRVKRFKETSRDRFLSAPELAKFLQALDGEPSDTWRDFFRLALATGARRMNCLSMRWADLDLERGLWRVPAESSKSGEAMLLVLSAWAVEILRGRQAGPAGQGEYVFPGPGARGHVMDHHRPWDRICQRAGLADVRLHDLRRTLGSWQALSGSSLPIIGKSLGHSSTAATAIYARLTMEPVRASVERATTAILGTRNLPAASENREDAPGSTIGGEDDTFAVRKGDGAAEADTEP